MSNLSLISLLIPLKISANFGVKFRHGGHQCALKKRKTIDIDFNHLLINKREIKCDGFAIQLIG